MSLKIHWIGLSPRRPIAYGALSHPSIVGGPRYLKFLVDTGADRTFISRESRDILGITKGSLQKSPYPTMTIKGAIDVLVLANCTLMFPDNKNSLHLFQNQSVYVSNLKNAQANRRDEDINVLGRDMLGEQLLPFYSDLPVIIDVLFTSKLTDIEVGLYHIHLGELHAKNSARDVHFLGERDESGCSMFRYQAESYSAIYRELSNLFAPFKHAQAIDWNKTSDMAGFPSPFKVSNFQANRMK